MVSKLKHLDEYAVRLLATYGPHCLRIGMGIVFVLFGGMKYVPGLSPAEGLVAETVSWAIDPAVFLPILATWEVAIGLGLLFRRYCRATLLLLFAHMGGTFMPLVTCPELVWNQFPFGFTLEGQYIVKDLALLSLARFGLAALVVLGKHQFALGIVDPSFQKRKRPAGLVDRVGNMPDGKLARLLGPAVGLVVHELHFHRPRL